MYMFWCALTPDGDCCCRPADQCRHLQRHFRSGCPRTSSSGCPCRIAKLLERTNSAESKCEPDAVQWNQIAYMFGGQKFVVRSMKVCTFGQMDRCGDVRVGQLSVCALCDSSQLVRVCRSDWCCYERKKKLSHRMVFRWWGCCD